MQNVHRLTGAILLSLLLASQPLLAEPLKCVTRAGKQFVANRSGALLLERRRWSEGRLEHEIQRLNDRILTRTRRAARPLAARLRKLEGILAFLRRCVNPGDPQATPVPTGTPGTIATPSVSPSRTPTSSPTPTPTSTPMPTPTPTPTPTPASKVPVFIAQGHAGRMTLSCDDGLTWSRNWDHTVAPNVRCWDNTLVSVNGQNEVQGCTDESCDDCDHQNWAGCGIAYGDGAFVATWGWGKPGQIQRSVDGIHWTTVLPGRTYADISFGSGVFMAGRGIPAMSSDNGVTWSDVAVPSSYNPWYNVRKIGFGVWPLGSRFYIFGDGDQLYGIDPDGGGLATSPHAAGCGDYVYGTASSPNTILSVHSNWNTQQVYVCRSADGGASWSRMNVANTARATLPLWTGSEFIFWGDSTRVYRSPDGVNWSTQHVTYVNSNLLPRFGAVARSDSGIYVTVDAEWGRYYQNQRFFRSEDGVTWTQLPAGAYVGSHPINHIEFGYVDPSVSGCPAS